MTRFAWSGPRGSDHDRDHQTPTMTETKQKPRKYRDFLTPDHLRPRKTTSLTRSQDHKTHTFRCGAWSGVPDRATERNTNMKVSSR